MTWSAISKSAPAGKVRRSPQWPSANCPRHYELAHVFRRRVNLGTVSPDDGWQALDRWRHLEVTRYPVFAVLDRIWELRHDLSAYDASYVSVAETLDCTLVTADGRLARASGIRCPVTLVPA